MLIRNMMDMPSLHMIQRSLQKREKDCVKKRKRN